MPSGDGSENVQKNLVGLISKKKNQQLCTCSALFLVHFLAVVLEEDNVKLPETVKLVTSQLHVTSPELHVVTNSSLNNLQPYTCDVRMRTYMYFFFFFSDTQREDGKIGVLNSQRLKTETGVGKNITGYAYIPDTKQPGKLKVRLQGGVPFAAPCK